MTGSYDFRLVTLSVVIAICASYAALDLAARISASSGRIRLAWLAGGAVAMGLGIWSMHYIGMLAFNLPVPVSYDWPTVLLSLLAAIFASAVALLVVSRQKMGWAQALAGSVIMGSGISIMHYTGMAAMRLPAMCSYDSVLVTLFRFGCDRNFTDCTLANVSFSRKRKILALTEDWQRRRDGSRDTGHALYRHGGSPIHTVGHCARHLACREYLDPRVYWRQFCHPSGFGCCDNHLGFRPSVCRSAIAAQRKRKKVSRVAGGSAGRDLGS